MDYNFNLESILIFFKKYTKMSHGTVLAPPISEQYAVLIEGSFCNLNCAPHNKKFQQYGTNLRVHINNNVWFSKRLHNVMYEAKNFK